MQVAEWWDVACQANHYARLQRDEINDRDFKRSTLFVPERKVSVIFILFKPAI